MISAVTPLSFVLSVTGVVPLPGFRALASRLRRRGPGTVRLTTKSTKDTKEYVEGKSQFTIRLMPPTLRTGTLKLINNPSRSPVALRYEIN